MTLSTTRSPFDDASGKQLIEFLIDNYFTITLPTSPKYLIAFNAGGGIGNTTTYARDNAQVMEAAADFDGTVIEAVITDPVLGLINAINSVARNYELPWALFAPPVSDLLAANFVRFKHNFVRANIASAQSVGYPIIDPFDPEQFNTYVHNLGIFARLAQVTGQRGLLLDTELYNSSVFWGPYSSLDGSHTEDEYIAKYKELGAASMEEINAQFPDGVVALAVSYEQVQQHPTTPPEDNTYWLQPHFLDGFHNAAKSPRQIVNIMEDGYSNQTPNDMAYDILFQTRAGLGSTLGSPNYEVVHQHGMSTWIDYPGSGFDFADPSQNYNTPALFKNNILLAAGVVPHYVFVYSQQVKWWNGTVGVNVVPTEYVTALAEAKAALP